MATDHLHIAVALDGAGWHPAAWREPAARPDALFSAGATGPTWPAPPSAVCSTSSTIEDIVRRPERSARRPTTRRRGPTRCAGGSTPCSSRVASWPRSRAGSGSCPSSPRRTPSRSTSRRPPRRSTTRRSAAQAGSRGCPGGRPRRRWSDGGRSRDVRRADLRDGLPPGLADLFTEAADVVEVVRALWDSWEDDAEIRDVATRRFIDRDKRAPRRLRGPLLLRARPVDHAAAPAGPTGGGRARAPRRAVRAGRPRRRPRAPDPAAVPASPTRRGCSPTSGEPSTRSAGGRSRCASFGDLVVVLDTPDETGAASGCARLDATAPDRAATRAVFAGSAAELADLLLGWQRARLPRRPAAPGRAARRPRPHRRRSRARAAAPRPLPHRPTRRRAGCAGCWGCPPTSPTGTPTA